ncbi:MAG: BamA/TamA family outer membrane protein [Vicinamibacteria bacterium]
MSRTFRLALLCGTFAPVGALAQEPTPSPTSHVQVRPEPTPAPATVEETGNLARRSLRSFLRDDESGDGRGIHAGPFLPRVAVLSSGGGPSPVLHLWAPDIGGTPLDFHASAAYSIYKYQYYDMQVGLLPHRDKRLPSIETGTNGLFPLSDIEKTADAPGFNVYASARYRDYPREDFFGVGANTSNDNHTDYRLRDGLYEGIVRFRLSHLSVMGRAGLLKTSILPGQDSGDPNTDTLHTEATAPGLFTGPDFIHTSIGGWLELRDEPGNPHKGAAFGLSFARFNDRNGSAYQFNRASFEGREYLPLGSRRSVIALKQTLSFDDPDEGSAVPFYLRSTLGGGSLLRGYASSRFRDDRLLYLIGEYRFEITPKIEIAAIYEAGKVYRETQDTNLKNLRTGWGAGIRLKSPRKVHVRLDVVHSDEGNRIHLKLGRSF